jgi:hypothetical protein
MASASNPSLSRLLLLSCAALGLSICSGQSVAAAPERITFTHKNFSDLRGILNVFSTFRSACLAQPVSRGLPEKLLPAGYRVVSSGMHFMGLESGVEPKAVVLSKTGLEESDFAEGHPFIELRFPTGAESSGTCRVVWKRAWDYPEGIETVMTNTAILFDPWLSFHLKAVRTSRPKDGFSKADSYSLVSDWAAPCFDGTWCRLDILLDLRLDEGISLTISRGKSPISGGEN